MKIHFFTFCFLISSFVFFQGALAEKLQSQFFVTAVDARAAQKLSKQVKVNFKVRVIDDRYLILVQKSGGTAALIQLKENPLVKNIKLDLPAQQRAFQGSCSKPPAFEPILAKIVETNPCEERSQCEPSGRTRLWAQEAIASDLAQEFLTQNKVKRDTKIAVIDSGFDSALVDSFENQNLSINHAHDGIQSNPKTDPTGHGTRVLSLINGKHGIGASTASSVSIYALGAKYSMGDAALGVRRACKEGAEIINLSVGVDGPLAKIVQIPVSGFIDESSIEEIEAKGCMVVHSAGNEGRNYSTSPNQNFEFEVGASTSNGKAAHFSSNSQFLVPGETVIGVQSKAEGKSQSQYLDDCGKSESFQSGTSLASPLFAAQLATSRDTLKTSPVFSSKPKAEQVAMLRELSKLSEFNGMTNSYIAVRIADSWARNPSGTLNQAKVALESELANSCQMVPESCKNLSSCKNKNVCKKELRVQGFTCGSNSQEAVTRLIDILQNEGDLEGASFWIRRFQAQWPSENLNLPISNDVLQRELKQPVQPSRLIRWVNYSGAMDKASGSKTQSPLKSLSTEMLFGSPDSMDKESKIELFAAMKGSGLLNEPETLRWIKMEMKKDGSPDPAFAHAIIRARREGIIGDVEYATIVESLISKESTPRDLTISSKLTSGIRPYEKHVSMRKKIALHPEVDDRTLATMATTELTDANMENDELSEWIDLTETVWNTGRAGPETANETMGAIMAVNMFNKRQSEKTKRAIQGIVAKLQPFKDQDANLKNQYQWMEESFVLQEKYSKGDPKP